MAGQQKNPFRRSHLNPPQDIMNGSVSPHVELDSPNSSLTASNHSSWVDPPPIIPYEM